MRHLVLILDECASVGGFSLRDGGSWRCVSRLSGYSPCGLEWMVACNLIDFCGGLTLEELEVVRVWSRHSYSSGASVLRPRDNFVGSYSWWQLVADFSRFWTRRRDEVPTLRWCCWCVHRRGSMLSFLLPPSVLFFFFFELCIGLDLILDLDFTG